MDANLKTDAAANREYKDSVFSLLFNNADTLIEVYNAIAGTNYGPDADIKLTTLDYALYRGRINDLSFVLDGKLIVLIEHQSTINRNMPFRMLLYIADNLNRLTKNDDLYSKKMITIPRPEFFVLYNGVDEMPDGKIIFKLSDMFAKPDHAADAAPDLELTVTMYNINKGRNIDIAKRSPTLDGYETFIHMIREFRKTMSLEEAIIKAVMDCINQNILKIFLENHKKEVVNMLTQEWCFETEMMVAKREAWEDGMYEAHRKNARAMKAKGIDLSTIVEITGLSVNDVLSL